MRQDALSVVCVLSMVLVSSACVSISRAPHEEATEPVFSRVVSSGAESVYVVETDRYDFVAQERSALRYQCLIDGVAARFERLFQMPPPRSAVVLLSKNAISPELLRDWTGVPMAVVVAEAEGAASEAPQQRYRTPPPAREWPTLQRTTAQMWMLVSGMQAVPGRIIPEELIASWFIVAATNLIAAPREARVLATAIGHQLIGTPTLDTLFARRGRPGVEVSVSPETSHRLERRATWSSAGLGESKPHDDALTLSLPHRERSLLDAQATSVLQYLVAQRSDVPAALLVGLSEERTTEEILIARGVLSRGLPALEADWRQWVSSQGTGTAKAIRLPADPCPVDQ